MDEKIIGIESEALQAFQKAENSRDLYDAKVRFLGKSGAFSTLLRELGKLSPDERKAVGRVANEARDRLESAYAERERKLKTAELSAKLQSEKIDVTLPGLPVRAGSHHPVWLVMNTMVEVFGRLGFSVRVGPHIERDFYNFDALNMPADHSARDTQDTFYVVDNEARDASQVAPWVLRTHTSPVQIRSMLTEKPPLRILSPGGVYRSDSDVSHSPHFHQLEGFVVDENVSMADLKGTLGFFARAFFGSSVKVRLRPSYFPFVEPGAELDASCPICNQKGCSMCKGSGWIELGGCGMIHPQVFQSVGIEYPKYNGFAFGMGIDRIAIVKYGISHIGLFFENDTRFLEQFP